jgi:hypothetical protein
MAHQKLRVVAPEIVELYYFSTFLTTRIFGHLMSVATYGNSSKSLRVNVADMDGRLPILLAHTLY